jgi:hypothetical protein
MTPVPNWALKRPLCGIDGRPLVLLRSRAGGSTSANGTSPTTVAGGAMSALNLQADLWKESAA